MNDAARFSDEFAILYKPLNVERFAGSHVKGNSNVVKTLAQNTQNSFQENKNLNFNSSMKYFGPASGCEICGFFNHTTES